MTDRELLELAAKAAGIEGFRYVNKEPIQGDYRTGLWSDLYEDCWNPLTDDGDALRLAVKLGFTVGPHFGATYAGVAPCPDDFEDGKFPIRIAQMHNDDPYAATRRAITRAAAEIGKGMRPFPSAEEIREEWT